MAEATDLYVESSFTREGLDELVQELGRMFKTPAVVGEHEPLRIRVYGDPRGIKFAVENQGYARVIKEEEVG